MKTRILSSRIASARFAATLAWAAALGLGLASAADQPTNDHPMAKTSSGGAGSNKLARDRNDLVTSNGMRANTVGRDTDMTDAKLTRGDRRFIEKAARNGMAENRAARLALARASDPRVRSYAQRLISDHEKTNAELNQLAGRKGVSMADEDDNDRLLNRLSDKKGADFDQKFVGHMADEHEDDIDLFEKASRKSDDAEIAAFASKQLPILQEHRSAALDIEKALKGK